jgi:hypothetical protein
MSKKSFKSAPKPPQMKEKSHEEFEVSGIGHDQTTQDKDTFNSDIKDKKVFYNGWLNGVILNRFSTSTFAGIFVVLLIGLIAVVGTLKPFNFEGNTQLSKNSDQLQVIATEEKFLKEEISNVDEKKITPIPKVMSFETQEIIVTSIGAAIGASSLLYLSGGTAAPYFIANQIGLLLPTTLYSFATSTIGAISGGYIGNTISYYWN